MCNPPHTVTITKLCLLPLAITSPTQASSSWPTPTHTNHIANSHQCNRGDLVCNQAQTKNFTCNQAQPSLNNKKLPLNNDYGNKAWKSWAFTWIPLQRQGACEPLFAPLPPELQVVMPHCAPPVPSWSITLPGWVGGFWVGNGHYKNSIKKHSLPEAELGFVSQPCCRCAWS